MLCCVESGAQWRAEQEARESERQITWFTAYTAGLLMVARSGGEIAIHYMPRGYAGDADYIVVWPETVRRIDGNEEVVAGGVYLTSNLEEANRLKHELNAQVCRNPEKCSPHEAQVAL